MKNTLDFILLAVVALGIGCLVAGCGSLESKAIGVASNGSVVKIESTGSTTSGTIMPNILFGTIQNSIAVAPALEDGAQTQIVVAYTESQSWIASVFGFTAVTRTFAYIGNPAESAEETKVRLDAVASVLKIEQPVQSTK